MRGFHVVVTLTLLVFLGTILCTEDFLHPFHWDAVGDFHYSVNRSDHTEGKFLRPFASTVLRGQMLYVSLTTIHNRIYGITNTVESIIRGTVWPDRIFIFVSRDPYLLDIGVSPEFILSETKGQLANLTQTYPWISLIFTENIGPHRKLLPLLAKKWNEDCAIVTIDDHETYKETTIESLIAYYEASGRSAVVALRARRMGICGDTPPWKLSPYTKKRKGTWPEASPGYREMLILPTGTGGVLYRPIFFHPFVFDRRFINSTRTGDDLMFRLATLTMGVPVVTACAERDALGKPCPPKILRLELYKEKSASMVNFTYQKNYTSELLRNAFLSPGVQSGHKNNKSDKSYSQTLSKKFRNKKKNKNNGFDDNGLSDIIGTVNHHSKKRSNLRKLEEASVEWKKDPRKIDSLASKFNTGGGNNLMWEDSVELLAQLQILNFPALLQHYAPSERTYCLMSTSMLSYGKQNRTKASLIERMKIAFQTSYNPQCGLCLCE
jgi:hypothetical protein